MGGAQGGGGGSESPSKFLFFLFFKSTKSSLVFTYSLNVSDLGSFSNWLSAT